MRLATLDDGTRDGQLVVVDSTGARAAHASHIALSLQRALDDWQRAEPELRALASELEAGRIAHEPLTGRSFRAPLPRAYEWIDGSAYLSHVRLVRRARGAEPPKTLETDPLIYQGGSGHLLGPSEPLALRDPTHGLDFEAEIYVVLGDLPLGADRATIERSIRLIGLCNDVTLRGLVPNELQKGFGFFQSKPATAFAPFVVTPDELGDAYRTGRVHTELHVERNGQRVGRLDTGAEMHFSFFDLVHHISRTRAFTAGTIVGSGTVSSEDASHGSACLAECRMRERIAHGSEQTPWLRVGDTLRIEAFTRDGRSAFGAIAQEVVAP